MSLCGHVLKGCGCGYGSVLRWGGGVQELGSDYCVCEDVLPDIVFMIPYEFVFTVQMIPYQAGLTN